MVQVISNPFNLKRARFLLALFVIFLSSCQTAHISYVDPFIGTDYTGHTFPAASCPMGMVQPGPQTGNYLWKYCSGYNYSDSTIIGFAQNRLNGTGVPSLCNILLMPSSVDKGTDWSCRKENETASAGFYSVYLPDNGVKVDISCTERVACYNFTYSGDCRYLFVNLQNVQMRDRTSTPSLRGAIKESEGRFLDENTLEGHIKANSWVEYDLWYRIVFDTPVIGVDTLVLNPEYVAPALVLDFGKGVSEVKAKVSISYTGENGPETNMSEVPGWDFEKVRRETEKKWEKILSLIEIDADEEVRKAFYTSLYHLYLQPNIISDKGDGIRYSTFSQWDTYRAADPLRTMLTPEIEADIVNNMIDYAFSRGHLPVWDLCGKDNYCMIANHSVPTVVEACLKKLPGIDKERAWESVRMSLTTNHQKSDWDIYDRYGYLPFDSVKVESVSRTLEFCYDDWCAAQLAKELGHTDEYDFFFKRSHNYLNLFDASTGFFRGKDSKGQWREPFEPYRYSHASHQGGDFTEGNAWHYLWHIQHEPEKLMELLGGKERFVEKLDSLFDISVPSELTGEASDVTGLIGQYSHGNEPCHHVIYLYTIAGRQDKAAEKVREVFSRFYRNEPGGLCGNDDCGQMSAWYIYSALGFYPVNPVSGVLIPGESQVKKAIIRNSSGKKIIL